MPQIFALSNLVVLPFWVLLILFPNQKHVRLLMDRRAPVVLLAGLYTLLVVPEILSLLPLLARPELGPIQAMLGTPEGATLIWIHVLAFDLLAALAIVEEDRKAKRAQWITSLNLICTLLFGPMGYLLHIIKKRVLQ